MGLRHCFYCISARLLFVYMEPFDWKRMLIGEDGSWLFLLEVLFRTIIMYLVLLIFFKITGKKEIKQLSIFDLILIIGLGSAAGDPMFYDDVPVLPAVVTFATILGLYTLITYLSQKDHKLNLLLQGDTVCIFHDNQIDTKALFKEGLTTEELFSELRVQRVSHLGQVQQIYLEGSGHLSIYFRPSEHVVYGLCILPEALQGADKEIKEEGTYSCVQCGNTQEYSQPEQAPCCKNCACEKWSVSSDSKRIT
jgi:uncharacterized membrane protein YcaP (DUF421 family)